MLKKILGGSCALFIVLIIVGFFYEPVLRYFWQNVACFYISFLLYSGFFPEDFEDNKQKYSDDNSNKYSDSYDDRITGTLRKPGEPYFDASGTLRLPEEPYIDSSGTWRNPGEPYFDASGIWRKPGEPYFDSSGILRKPNEPYRDYGKKENK